MKDKQWRTFSLSLALSILMGTAAFSSVGFTPFAYGYEGAVAEGRKVNEYNIVFISKWGGEGSGYGQFREPRGIATSSDGSVFVTDTLNHRIQKFDQYGNFVASLGTKGTSYGMFYNPSGISIDTQGYVYVADSGNNRIQVFTKGGYFITAWGTGGTAAGQFSFPSDVFVDPVTSQVYVVDTYNNRIQAFNKDGEYLFAWGGAGAGNGQFINPVKIFVSYPDVYVVDASGVQVFDTNGVYASRWGERGSAEGKIFNPHGVVFDGTRFYLVDTDNSRLQEFDSDGVFSFVIGSQGAGYGEFNRPYGIALSPYGFFYVTDTTNNTIQQFGKSLPNREFSITGQVTTADGKGVPDVRITFKLVTKNGNVPGEVLTGKDGKYTQTGFTSLGTYLAYAAKEGYTFSPKERPVSTFLNTGIDFTATPAVPQ